MAHTDLSANYSDQITWTSLISIYPPVVHAEFIMLDDLDSMSIDLDTRAALAQAIQKLVARYLIPEGFVTMTDPSNYNNLAPTLNIRTIYPPTEIFTHHIDVWHPDTFSSLHLQTARANFTPFLISQLVWIHWVISFYYELNQPDTVLFMGIARGLIEYCSNALSAHAKLILTRTPSTSIATSTMPGRPPKLR